MTGTLNAAGVIAVVVFTCAVLWRFGQNPIKPRRLVIGILSGLVCAVLSTFGGCTHCCGAGLPVSQWLVPSVCVGLLIATFERPRVQRPAAVAIVVVGAALCYQFVELVHEPGYTGSPTWEEKICKDIDECKLKLVRDTLRSRGVEDVTMYPAGWLDEPPLVELIPENRRGGLRGRTAEISLFWHSRFTGLYRKEVHQNLRIWYPGGGLLQAVDLLDFRPPSP